MKFWIARNKDGSLTLFENEPYYNDIDGFWYDVFEIPIADDLQSTLFSEVTLKNSPQEVELKFMNENVDIAESPIKTFPRINEFEVGASYRR